MRGLKTCDIKGKEGLTGYWKELNKETYAVFAWKKQCVYCNSYVRQNLRMRCSLNFEFGTDNVIKYIFIFFNVNKVTQHVN